MKFIWIDDLLESHKQELLKLWNKEYPARINYNSIQEFEDYLSGLSNASNLLILDEKDQIKGWYVDFDRDNQKWFALILDASLHGKGLGSQILNMVKEKENELNGWVVDHNRDQKSNGEFYHSPIDFYLKNGFRVLPNERIELEKISGLKINWTKSRD